MWPDVKIAALKDEGGNVTGHRYEARMFGVGVHQHKTAHLLTSALAFHDDFAQSVDALLARYGFIDGDLRDSYDLTLNSYAAAREHNGDFFNIAYGNGTMSEFSVEFADLIETLAVDLDMEAEFAPISVICRSGCTDGKVNRLLFPELKDVLAFQKSYDDGIFDDSNKCARMIFEKEIEKKTAGICSLAQRV